MCGIWQGSGKNRVGVDLASLRKATWPEVLLGVRTQPGVWLSSDHPDLDLFERHPERSDSWPWPHHSRSLPSPNTTIIDTRPSPRLWQGHLGPLPVSFPPGSQVSGGRPCLVAWNPSKGRGGLVQRTITQTSAKPNRVPLKQSGPCGAGMGTAPRQLLPAGLC